MADKDRRPKAEVDEEELAGKVVRRRVTAIGGSGPTTAAGGVRVIGAPSLGTFAAGQEVRFAAEVASLAPAAERYEEVLEQMLRLLAEQRDTAAALLERRQEDDDALWVAEEVKRLRPAPDWSAFTAWLTSDRGRQVLETAMHIAAEAARRTLRP